MSACVLLHKFINMILGNKLGKRDKVQGLLSILSLFTTSLMNLLIQEHEC